MSEPLIPELEAMLNDVDGLGPCIRHPLLYAVPYFESLNATLNTELLRKKRRLEKALADGAFQEAISCYERPYRVQAFHNLSIQMPDDQYWEILSWVWTDAENFYQNKKLWLKLFWAKRDHRERFMNESERLVFESLGDCFFVYRGHSSKSGKGISYTLDSEIAEWFAKKSAIRGPGQVSIREVEKTEIFAYLNKRGEHEILIIPERERK